MFEQHPARTSSLGNLPIWRALPRRGRRTVGPWCFLDRYGPLTFTDEKPMDVAPHPHIGLQTVSWLLDGEVLHRDSLGCEAMARPGAVNIMTSGRGIAHTEETPKQNRGRLDGVQLWIALPPASRDAAPAFHPVSEVPRIEMRGATLQLFAGSHRTTTSPAPTFSDLIGLDIELRRGASIELEVDTMREHALYLLHGDARFERDELPVNALCYVGEQRSSIVLASSAGARLLLLGGSPLDESPLMWWNFVASSPEEIAAARQEWESRGERFGEVSGYDGPRIPAPPLSRLAPPNPAS